MQAGAQSQDDLFQDIFTLLSVDSTHCRWPLWNGEFGDMGVCGKKALIGKPYCLCHHKMAHQPMKVAQK